MTEQTMTAKMAEIRELARSRRHRMAPHMLGTRPLTTVQADLVLAKLRGCPSLEDAPPAAPVVSRESAPSVPPPLAAFKDAVPAGYYATRRPDEPETIDYYKIDEGKKGKWAGYKFARRVLGGTSSGDRKLRTVEMTNMQQRLALQAITQAGIEDSQNLFADTLTRCKDCSSPLTDETSRAARLGPVCRNKKH